MGPLSRRHAPSPAGPCPARDPRPTSTDAIRASAEGRPRDAAARLRTAVFPAQSSIAAKRATTARLPCRSRRSDGAITIDLGVRRRPGRGRDHRGSFRSLLLPGVPRRASRFQAVRGPLHPIDHRDGRGCVRHAGRAPTGLREAASGRSSANCGKATTKAGIVERRMTPKPSCDLHHSSRY